MIIFKMMMSLITLSFRDVKRSDIKLRGERAFTLFLPVSRPALLAN